MAAERGARAAHQTDRPLPPWAWPAALLACLLPLAVTPVLPFVDFYAHVARYYVLARIDTVPALEENYTAAWKLLPNLGLDVLGTALMEVIPPLPAARLLAALMILAPPAGMAALSAALHGRVTAPALLGGAILAYSHILIWGFANFLVGLGLGLAGLALWIALRRRPGLQIATALPFALALFFVHGLAFALWGLMLGCVELALAWQAGDRRPRALLRRMARLASLALLPALLFTQMDTAAAEGGVTPALGNLAARAETGGVWPRIAAEIADRIDVTLRVADSGHPWTDRALGALLWAGLASAYAAGALRLDRRLWLACALAALLVVAMPPSMFGVGYLHDRAPLLLAALLLAGSVAAPGAWGRAAVLGLAGLMALRAGLVTAGWAGDGQVYRAYLAALETHETGPLGAPVLLGQTGGREARTTPCKPLSFLMLLQNGTAVNTFAFASQQPIERDGPMAAAAAALSARARAQAAEGAAPAPAETLQAMAGIGFSALVVCSEGAPPPPPPGFAVAAAQAPWTLYLRQP